jgi:hypothetical protein
MRIVPVASIAKIKLRRALVVYQEDNASKYTNQTVKPEMGSGKVTTLLVLVQTVPIQLERVALAESALKIQN